MPVPDNSMAGRTCLVTGATSGIGLVTSRELARRSARVVMVGRNPQRTALAAADIRRDTGNDAVEFLCADLSSLAEVRRLAHEFLAHHDRLHVLINNAGAMFALRRQSMDGIEMTLALNHAGPFLLTNLLLPTIRASAPARIINVSSGAHKDIKAFDFDDPNAKRRRGYGQSESVSLLYALTMPWAHPGFVQYAHTKLANLLFTSELSRRLAGTGITANALHPGFVKTNFTTGNGALGFFMRLWSRLFGLTPEQGADTILYLATSPDVEAVTGNYFVKRATVPPSAAAQDPHAAARLWRYTESLVGLPPSKSDQPAPAT